MSKTEDDNYGFIPIDDWEEKSFTVPIQQFDYSQLDKPEDYIREAMAEGRDIIPIIKQIMAHRAAELKRDGAVAVLSEILASNNARRMALVMCVASGMHLTMGKSGPKIAKELNISKQALQQAVDRFRVKMGLPKTRTMRSEDARKAMAKAWKERHCGDKD